jgi:2-polyprenyl-3-methyl-5-hydroxy-6-metoxy-1,4-benzoquinol methylase
MADPITSRGLSSPDVRKWVCKYIAEDVEPKRVLDLGCGIGLYGATTRVLHREKADNIHFIGLDGFLPYLMQDTARQYYRTLIWGKIEDVVSGHLKVKADLTICMDVIEHFEKFAALAILKMPGKMIISTPLFDLRQGAVGDNILEAHRCWFSEKELNLLGFRTLCKFDYVQSDGQHGPIGAFERRR